MTNTAILYARASTKEQSTNIQVRQLTDYCRKNGIEIKGTYTENVSGASAEKEQLDFILNSEPLADMLIIREISRLSRETDYIQALSKVNQLAKKYTLYILGDNYTIPKGEVLNMSDGVMLMVKLYAAADEREKIRLRTQEARRRYRQNPDNNHAGQLPYGLTKAQNPNYIKGVNTKMIVVKDEEKWEQVVRIFQMKMDGLSYKQIADATGLPKTLIVSIIRTKRLKEMLGAETVRKVKEKNAEKDSSPTPTKHENQYKDRIFFEDTHYALVHHVTSYGHLYVRENGGLSLNKTILDNTVRHALQSFVLFFNIKRDDLREENARKLETLNGKLEGLRTTFAAKTAEADSLKRKALRTEDDSLFDFIREALKKSETEAEKVLREIERTEKEIKHLENFRYEEDTVIDESNIKYYYEKFVDAIRVWHTRRFHYVIKVFIKPEFVPEGFLTHKAYEAVSVHNGKSLVPVEEGEIVYSRNVVDDYYWGKNGSH